MEEINIEMKGDPKKVAEAVKKEFARGGIVRDPQPVAVHRKPPVRVPLHTAITVGAVVAILSAGIGALIGSHIEPKGYVFQSPVQPAIAPVPAEVGG